jgi:16S rRNA (guanine527-N7)-methyltransferase
MKTTDAEKLLSDGIRALCEDAEIERIFANREIIPHFCRYINEIELFNSAYGLVGTVNTEEIVIRHILDSLAPLGKISLLLGKNTGLITPKIADAGSGAGLPGIPLAIALPNCEFTLIERMGRRAGFLYNTSAILKLSNVTVEEGELEKTGDNRFSLVTFRAFKPMESKLLKTLSKVCVKGGIIAAYKGKLEKIKAEITPLEKICGGWEALPYTVPFLDEELEDDDDDDDDEDEYDDDDEEDDFNEEDEEDWDDDYE